MNKNYFQRAITLGFFLFFMGTCPLFARADVLDQRTSFIVEPQYGAVSSNKSTATLVKVGSGMYFYIEDTYWSLKSEKERSEIFSILEKLDSEFVLSIKPKLNSAFGLENYPGIDKDPKVTVLFYSLKGSARGYVRNIDGYSKFINPSSNEREMIYLNIDHISSNYLKEFLTHEYMHLITINQTEMKNNGQSEDVWLSEALSEYAVSLAGYDNKENSYLENRISVFVNNPSNSLNNWSNEVADYGMVSVFSHYLVEKYGINIFKDALKSNKVGIDSINEALAKNGFTEKFQKIFVDFTVASYLNDCKISDKFCFKEEKLKNMHVFTLNNFLPSSGESNIFLGQSLANYSAQWQKFIGGTGDIKFKFKGSPSGYSSVYYIIRKPNDVVIVDYLRLSPTTKEGELVIKNMGKDVMSIVFIPSMVTFTSVPANTKYYYSLSASTFIANPTVKSLPITISRPLDKMTKDELIEVLLRLLAYVLSQQQSKYSSPRVVY